jgi:hypothetical protein
MNRSLVIVALFVWGGAIAGAQDFRKVVTIVDELETSLKKMITQEQADRKSDVAALRQEVDRLRELRPGPGMQAPDVAATTAGLVQLSQRLERLELRTDEMHRDFTQLTKAVALLVAELKASGQDKQHQPPAR